MSLKEYNKKRNLKKTGEPSTRKQVERKTGKKLTYVIHEHHASHLHWDLRLEMDGVLKSWAIPKIPPKTKSEKRLAIQVEDHPLSYKDFSGIIPEGNYGAGKVEIWDKGSYELESRKPSKIVININGKKLKGKYVLIKTNYGGKPEKAWMFFKT